MADPVSEIEAQLKRPVTLADANDQRKKLNDSFGLLNPDQAQQLLERLLTSDSSRLLLDFRRLDRAIRLELLLRLAMRLGTQTSARFHARLTGRAGAKDADPKLQQGLRIVFPDAMQELRQKFLQALSKPTPAAVPSVLLEFRNDGKLSPDNQCESRKYVYKDTKRPFVPDRLGPEADPERGNNRMEIRGTVTGHRPDAEYRFGRTMEQANWCLVGSKWRCTQYAPAETNDNTHRSDEDDHPDNDHIYSIDGPGPPIPPNLDRVPAAERSDVTEFVYAINAVETVEVRVGKGAWLQVGKIEWFSVTWLEKTGTTWRRTPGKSKIAKGSISDMEINATVTGEPPTTF